MRYIQMGGERMGAAALCGIAALFLLGGPASAQGNNAVKLLSPDGMISIAGDFVSFDNDYYTVDTNLGRLKISTAKVDCFGLPCPQVVADVRWGIHGSRTVGTTLIPNLLRGYAEHVGGTFAIEGTDDPATRIARLYNGDGSLRAEIDLQTRGSGSAFPALIDDHAEIGLTDRRLKGSDLEKLTAAGLPDLRDTENEIVLGVDGIVLITHPDNPVRNLTTEEIAKIWSGEITNWMELGGGDHPINVHSYGESSGDRAVLLDGIVRPNGRDETVPVTRHGPYQDLVDAVMSDRGSIGYVGRWLARTNDVRLIDIREDCGLLSPPTDFRMKIEGYSLSRRLYAYKRPGEMNPEARAFIDWTLTDEAQPYIKEAHFIDRDLERMQLQDMGMSLIHTAAVEPDFDGVQYAQMMSELRHADRLSTSFRFRTGSSTLDVESVRNLRELAARMEAGEFDGQEVLLVGFADSVGKRESNTALAGRRAQEVRRILSDALPFDVRTRLRLTPLSYGELLPLSCNTSDVGRERNRRVEVWLRRPAGA